MNTKILSLTALLLASGFSVNASEKDTDEKQSVDSQCGQIILYNQPPSTKNLHFASISSINGQVVSSSATSFSLSPGKHILRVQEHINEEALTRRRGEAKNFHLIEFVVEPNKKYSLAAQYNRKYRNKFKSGAYWTPTVWKTKDSECML
jgi:hypothetical protein